MKTPAALYESRRVRWFSRAAVFAAAGLLSLGALGCKGEMGLFADDPGVFEDPTNPGTTSNNNSGGGGTVTTPMGEVVPTSAHLRRLTPAQYANTVRYALGDVFSQEDLPQFGDDIPIIGLNNDPSSLRVSGVNIDSLYQSTEVLAQAAVQNTPVVRDCVAASGDACFAEIADDLGSKLWRRPLTDAEKQDLEASRQRVADAPGTRAEQAEFLVMALLASPNMLYRTELGVAEGDVQKLTDYELASALSYTLWNAPPDQELRDLAAAGELSHTDTLKEQARRMADDPRVAEAFTEFFIDYLKIEAIFSKEKIDELGLTPEARASLVEGIREDLRQIFSVPGATLLDPFRAMSFHVDENSAEFFGVPVTQQEGFEVISMDPDQRLGVLSHPAFLSVHAGEGDSGIVKRGVFTLEQLLCVELGAPPADISESEDVPEDFNDDEATSREVLSVRHSSQPTCVGCHRIIDPAGFGFENYDSVGRYRTVEKGDVEIDASGELQIGQEVLNFDNSIGYIDALVESEALRSCLTDQYFTYVLGDEPRRVEREMLYAAFDENDGALDALVESMIETPSFTVRNEKLEQAQE